MKFFLSLLLCTCLSDSLNILVYSPLFAHSHSNFMGKIADILQEAGHNVIVLQPIFNTKLMDSGTKLCEVIPVTPDASWIELVDSLQVESAKSRWHADATSFGAILKAATNFAEIEMKMCQRIVSDTDLLGRLASFKFDVAFVEMYESCGYGVVHLLNITTYHTATSSIIGNTVGGWVGAPTPISYVPSPVLPFTDRMSFTERLTNALAYYLEEYLMTTIIYSTQAAFAHIEGFPDIKELLINSTFIFTNKEPFVEFPSPSIYRIIDIGGIAVPPKTSETLNEKWSSILSLRPQTILISFGSMSKSIDMPEEYKEAIVETCKRFLNVTFIWKYENDSDHNVLRGADNIVLKKWVPQTDLLSDTRLTGFVTHGGMGSVNELMNTGKKAIVVPLFADQFHNAKVLSRMNTVITYEKLNLDNATKLYDAIHQLLTDERLSHASKHLFEMIASRPFSVRDQLIKYTEFSAKFGPFPQLIPHCTKLNFVEFHLLDVCAVLLCTLVSCALILIYCVKKMCNSCRRKLKTD